MRVPRRTATVLYARKDAADVSRASKHPSTRPYVGVNLHKNTGNFEGSFWYSNYPSLPASSSRSGRQFYLGTWNTPGEAARAHDLMALNVRGLDARLNFELDTYDAEYVVEQPFDLLLAVIKHQAMVRRPQSLSGYRGVATVNHGSRGFEARLHRKRDGVHLLLGRFKTPEEAAQAYDEAVKSSNGDLSTLNFPGGADARAVELEAKVTTMIDFALDPTNVKGTAFAFDWKPRARVAALVRASRAESTAELEADIAPETSVERESASLFLKEAPSCSALNGEDVIASASMWWGL